MDKVFESLMDDFAQENLDAALEDMQAAMEAKEQEEEELEDEIAEESLANAALLDCASPDEIADCAESYDEVQGLSETFGVAMEKTITRLDRKARFRHLSKQGELNIARKMNDPNYKKLMKIWAMERELEKRIHQRWGSKGEKIARTKIRDYAANGKRINKPNPSTVSFKGKVSSRVAAKAVASSKKMFSGTNHTTVPGRK